MATLRPAKWVIERFSTDEQAPELVILCRLTRQIVIDGECVLGDLVLTGLCQALDRVPAAGLPTANKDADLRISMY